MRSDENKALVRRWLEGAYNAGDLDVVDAAVAPTYVNHSRPHGQQAGRAGEKQYVTAIRTAFPDFSLRIEDQIAEGDKVVTRCTASGTYQGGLDDIPVSAVVGTRVSVAEILIHRIEGGQVTEGWMAFDELGLWRQLGVV
jgi:predicted ester cyclase